MGGLMVGQGKHKPMGISQPSEGGGGGQTSHMGGEHDETNTQQRVEAKHRLAI